MLALGGALCVPKWTTATSNTGVTAIVTHAGLTSTWWQTNLASETEPRSVVDAINNAACQDLHFGGEMLQGTQPDAAPSPIWASSTELWASWTSQVLPWPQVHGC